MPNIDIQINAAGAGGAIAEIEAVKAAIDSLHGKTVDIYINVHGGKAAIADLGAVGRAAEAAGRAHEAHARGADRASESLREHGSMAARVAASLHELGRGAERAGEAMRELESGSGAAAQNMRELDSGARSLRAIESGAGDANRAIGELEAGSGRAGDAIAAIESGRTIGELESGVTRAGRAIGELESGTQRAGAAIGELESGAARASKPVEDLGASGERVASGFRATPRALTDSERAAFGLGNAAKETSKELANVAKLGEDTAQDIEKTGKAAEGSLGKLGEYATSLDKATGPLGQVLSMSMAAGKVGLIGSGLMSLLTGGAGVMSAGALAGFGGALGKVGDALTKFTVSSLSGMEGFKESFAQMSRTAEGYKAYVAEPFGAALVQMGRVAEENAPAMASVLRSAFGEIGQTALQGLPGMLAAAGKAVGSFANLTHDAAPAFSAFFNAMPGLVDAAANPLEHMATTFSSLSGAWKDGLPALQGFTGALGDLGSMAMRVGAANIAPVLHDMQSMTETASSTLGTLQSSGAIGASEQAFTDLMNTGMKAFAALSPGIKDFAQAVSSNSGGIQDALTGVGEGLLGLGKSATQVVGALGPDIERGGRFVAAVGESFAKGVQGAEDFAQNGIGSSGFGALSNVDRFLGVTRNPNGSIASINPFKGSMFGVFNGTAFNGGVTPAEREQQAGGEGSGSTSMVAPEFSGFHGVGMGMGAFHGMKFSWAPGPNGLVPVNPYTGEPVSPDATKSVEGYDAQVAKGGFPSGFNRQMMINAGGGQGGALPPSKPESFPGVPGGMGMPTSRVPSSWDSLQPKGGRPQLTFPGQRGGGAHGGERPLDEARRGAEGVRAFTGRGVGPESSALTNLSRIASEQNQVASSSRQMAGAMDQAGQATARAMGQGASSAGRMAPAVQRAAQQAPQAMQQAAAQVQQPAQQMAQAVPQALQQHAPSVAPAAQQMVKQVQQQAPAAQSAGESIGGAIADGGGQGITKNVTKTITEVVHWVKKVIDAGAGALGISSPSRVFYEMGAQVVEGFNLGITSRAGTSAGAARQLMQGTIGAAQNQMNGVNGARSVPPLGSPGNPGGSGFPSGGPGSYPHRLQDAAREREARAAREAEDEYLGKSQLERLGYNDKTVQRVLDERRKHNERAHQIQERRSTNHEDAWRRAMGLPPTKDDKDLDQLWKQYHPGQAARDATSRQRRDVANLPTAQFHQRMQSDNQAYAQRQAQIAAGYKAAYADPLAKVVSPASSLMQNLAANGRVGGQQVGASTGQGVQQGINASSGGVGKAAGDMMNKAVNQAKSTVKSHSPSEVFAGIGSDSAAGVVQGMSDGMSDAISSASYLTQGIASNAGLQVGYIWAQSMVSGVYSTMKKADFTGGGWPQIGSPQALEALGQANLLGGAGAGAQVWNPHASMITFGGGTPAVEPKIEVHLTMDGQPVRAIATQVVTEGFDQLASSITRQRG